MRLERLTDAGLLRKLEQALLALIRQTPRRDAAPHYILLGRTRELALRRTPLPPKERAAALSWLWDAEHGPARGHA